MQSFADIPEMLRTLQPEHPVYCVYPDIIRKTTERFLNGFPGRVLYALKANNEPVVVQSLVDAGICHFDCASLIEIEQVRRLSGDVRCYFMNPVRMPNAARVAQEIHGVRHFVVDHASGLDSLLDEIDPRQSVIFVRMAVHHPAAMIDLSSKFGASPDNVVALLEAVEASGAEPALAFNVGSSVMSPDAFVQAMETAQSVLEKLSFGIRLLDVGGGYPKSYPGFEAPPLEEYFAAIENAVELPLAKGGELLAEPGRALCARGLSAVVQVLLRKDDCLYLSDGMYGVFWDLRYHLQDRFAARVYRGDRPLQGALLAFRLYGPTCDSGDVLPGTVELPENIQVGDQIEFGSIGAYSLSGRTDFNGFYSDTVVRIESVKTG